MKRYIAQRLGWTALATFIILTITFVLMDIVPDQRVLEAQNQAIQQGVSLEEAATAERERLGLDRPLHERYFDYLVNFVQFNWGWSDVYTQPVVDVIAERIPYSLMYAAPAIIISTIVGTVLGLYSAINQHTSKDYAATFFAFFGISIPNWWFGLLLLIIFGTFLGWIDLAWNAAIVKDSSGSWTLLSQAGESHPAFFTESFDGKRYVGVLSPTNLKQLILPTLVLTTTSIATVMRFARAEALEYIDADFVKTARSKGIPTRTIVAKHIFRPAAVPLMTIYVGRILGLVLAGSFLIEIVFGIPGIGEASLTAITNQDHDLVLFTILVPTFLAIFGNLVEDIMYAVLDPRIEVGNA